MRVRCTEQEEDRGLKFLLYCASCSIVRHGLEVYKVSGDGSTRATTKFRMVVDLSSKGDRKDSTEVNKNRASKLVGNFRLRFHATANNFPRALEPGVP